MSLLLRNARNLFSNHLLGRVGGKPAPSRFWYLPEPPRVVDDPSYQAYLNSANPSPLYLMDYSRKLEYSAANSDGILVLNYGGSVGSQINPEACFQYALACHDEFRATGDGHFFEKFVRYAEYFRKTQDDRGLWLYRFRWFRSPNPWYSVLSQTRGISVMLRAYLLTGRIEFRDAAFAAVGLLRQPLANGGLAHLHAHARVEYYEEYPFQPTAVINGAMAALFGLYELGLWADHTVARTMFQEGITSLERMLPFYTTRWWTLYDLDPDSPFPNVNSPRYHVLATDYLRVLSALSGSEILAGFRDQWSARNTRANRARAFTLKAFKKLVYR